LGKKTLATETQKSRRGLKFLRVFRASMANIMLKYAQKGGKIIEQKLKAIPWVGCDEFFLKIFQVHKCLFGRYMISIWDSISRLNVR